MTQTELQADNNNTQIADRFLRFLRDSFTEQERIAELSNSSYAIVINDNPFNSEAESTPVGLNVWNRKIWNLIDREIERATIPADLVDRYARFKGSGVYQNVERRVLNEFGFQDVYAAEQQSPMGRDISMRILYYLLTDHPEQLLELLRICNKIFPILARSLQPQGQPLIPEATPATR